MTKIQSSTRNPYANVANDLSTSFASLLPVSGADVGPFLFEAAYALGEKEADLARILGVSRATLSGWKKRGVIPASHLTWFSERFAVQVLEGSNPPQHEGFRHVGLELALALFEATAFDPFDLPAKGREDRIFICWRYLGGISRLGLFILRRLEPDRAGANTHINDRWWTEVLPQLGALVALSGKQMF